MPLAFAPPPGEISDALEAAFDRYLVPSQCVTGVIAQSYHQSEKSASEFDAIVAQTEQFLADNGRRPRILIAKMGGMDTIAARK